MGKVLIGALWLATVGAAFLLGSERGGSDDGGAVTEVARGAGADARSDDPGPTLRAAPPPAAGEARPGGGQVPGANPLAEADGHPTEVGVFTLEGVTSMEEASARLMAHVSALLAKGPQAHLELLRFFNDEVVDNKELQSLAGGSDEEMARFIYPWVKFLIRRESQVVDLTETVYKTMAEDPQAFAEFDNDTLEIFTEGVAVILPGVVDEERLDTFRGYAQKIMELPEDGLPKSVQRNRRDVQRALTVWAPPMSADEALARIQSGEITPGEALAVLKRVPPEQLEGLDVVPVLAPAIRTGDYRAIQALRRIPLAPGDVALLDQAALQGAVEGRWHQWTVRNYLVVTKRHGWPAPQALIESALATGGKAAAPFAEVLAQMKPPAPADYVAWVLDTYELPDPVRKRLRTQFSLGK